MWFVYLSIGLMVLLGAVFGILLAFAARRFAVHGRGTAERWIQEGKNAVNWTRLSCHDHDFVDNQVRQSA